MIRTIARSPVEQFRAFLSPLRGGANTEIDFFYRDDMPRLRQKGTRNVKYNRSVSGRALVARPSAALMAWASTKVDFFVVRRHASLEEIGTHAGGCSSDRGLGKSRHLHASRYCVPVFSDGRPDRRLLFTRPST
jgi:hypothetical protein